MIPLQLIHWVRPPFLGNFTIFHCSDTFSSSQTLLKRVCKSLALMSLLSFLIYALMLSDLVVLLFFNFLTDLLITSSVIFEFLYLLGFFHFNICVFRILSIEYWTEEFLPSLDLILFIMQDVSSVKIPHNCFVILCRVLICHLYYFLCDFSCRLLFLFYVFVYFNIIFSDFLLFTLIFDGVVSVFSSQYTLHLLNFNFQTM